MRYAVDPRQKPLFDPGEVMFSQMAIQRLRQGWQGLFRSQLLHLMPAAKLAENFHPTLGCPTKELYSMAGAIFLQEFFDLTIEQTVERYLLDSGWHYALNLVPNSVGISHATIERYRKLFAENDLAADVFHRVTSALIEALDLDISRQRLDSTHVFSDMATFGRSRLMGVTIKRFLTQLKRHHRPAHDALPEELLARYAPSQAKLFGDFKGKRSLLRQAVAEDLLFLVNRFADDPSVTARTSYLAMAQVLAEQCQVSEDKTTVQVKPKTGGNVLQNPSDPDATYDGHKGPGYQAQIVETCGKTNDQQLIMGVQEEPAHCVDAEALEPMLEQLQEHDRLPESLLADTHYGSDANVVAAEAVGVDLQSPVGGTPLNPDDLTVDDFAVQESDETVQCCPNGCVPMSSRHDAQTGQTTTRMRAEDCDGCAFRDQCPVRKSGGEYVLRHTPSQRRLAARRAEQRTETFGENYAIRAGGESVNSGLKRRTGLGRVRTRGRPRVRMAILLRCAGWNILRALAALQKRRKRASTSAAGLFGRLFGEFCLPETPGMLRAALGGHFPRQSPAAQALVIA